MMSKADFAALIAMSAALASAIGDVVRQRSAQEVTDNEVGHLELFGLSVRAGPDVVARDEAVSNHRLRRAVPEFS
jgi:hypothetical protein